MADYCGAVGELARGRRILRYLAMRSRPSVFVAPAGKLEHYGKVTGPVTGKAP